MRITKQIEWDMGHRIPKHKSQCCNLHGHRYKLEICLAGSLVAGKDLSDKGMVIDFSDIKAIAMHYVHDICDHAFMVSDEDEIILSFFRDNPDLVSIVVPFIPTAENIVLWAFEQLEDKYSDTYGTGLQLEYLRLWETPTSSAYCDRQEYHKYLKGRTTF